MFGRTVFPIAACLSVAFALSACSEGRPVVRPAPTAVTPGPQASPTVVPPEVSARLPTAVPTTMPALAAVATVVIAQPKTPTPSPTPTETPELDAQPTPTRTPTATASPVPAASPPQATPNTTPEPTATPITPAPTEVPEPPVATNGTPPIADEVLQTDADETLTTVDVVKLLRPSVVHIGTQTVEIGMTAETTPEGVGTGIILDELGHILTNNHVVDGAESIIVTLSTGESFTAELVGKDESTDTAVIRIEADGLQPAKLGVSSELEVGEDVISIGHAFDLRGGPTVSKGVVSALGRSLETNREFQITIVDLIQTDASINPGNSGGPLVNARAEVVGVNTAIIQDSRGIGFAINIDDVKLVAAQLIENGFVTRGFLGIRPANITPAIASRFGFPVTEGIYLQLVHAGTPAEAAGLLIGDIIVQLGDEPIANTGEMSKFLIAHQPGETVDITFYREEEEGWRELTIEITLGERPQ